MVNIGHTHEHDGKRYGTCPGCIEEKWLGLRLQGKTKVEADAIIRQELLDAGYIPGDYPEQQLSA